jgi:small subunit ribosomal protein S17
MKKFKGKVVSTKMNKTTVVEVESYRFHPLYHKRIKRTKKYHVHDEKGVQPGEEVVFGEIRPMAKTKRWQIVERSQDDSVKK